MEFERQVQYRGPGEMLEMKVNDLTERQRMKDRDGLWAAIYSHIYQTSLTRWWNSLSRRITQTSNMNTRKAGRWRQETDRTISLAEIMSNEHRAVYFHETQTLNLFVAGVPRFARSGMRRGAWHIFVTDRSTWHLCSKHRRFTLTDLKGHCKFGSRMRIFMKWFVSSLSSHTPLSCHVKCHLEAECSLVHLGTWIRKVHKYETDRPHNIHPLGNCTMYNFLYFCINMTFNARHKPLLTVEIGSHLLPHNLFYFDQRKPLFPKDQNHPNGTTTFHRKESWNCHIWLFSAIKDLC